MPDGRKISGNRLGTVGQPLPGTAVKTIDPDTGADLPAGTEGVIAVKGPQVMVGYLNRPEATAQVKKDGWYSPATWAMSTPTASSRSPTGSAGSPRSPARWCRTWESSRRSWRRPASTSTTWRSPAFPIRSMARRSASSTPTWGCRPAEVHQRLDAGPMPKVWIPSIRDFVHVAEIPDHVHGQGRPAGTQGHRAQEHAADELSLKR